MTSNESGYRSASVALERLSHVAVLIAVGFVLWAAVDWRPKDSPAHGAQSISVPAEPIEIGPNRLGAESATVAILGFSDFQCPYCQTFALDVAPALKEKYIDKGSVILAFRHLPIERLHPQARAAARLAHCAGSTGKFWQVHDAFFVGRSPDTVDGFQERAIAAGMTTSQVVACGTNPDADRVITQDVELAGRLGITGTPSFLVGTYGNGLVTARSVIVGAKTPAAWASILDSHLSAGVQGRGRPQ